MIGARAPRGRAARLVALAVVLVATVVAYRPGLGGPFLFDDYTVFVRSPALKMTELDVPSVRDALFSASRGWPRRGLSRASFAFNHYFSGGRFDPVAVKTTNLAIHLLNGLLVLALTTVLVRRLQAVGSVGPDGPSGRALAWLPLLATAAWLLHPVHLTAVLYAVQRMTSMTATIVLVALLAFLHGRARIEAGRAGGIWWMTASLGAGIGLGFLSKQSAVLLPFFAFLIEIFFFDRASLGPRRRRALQIFYALTVGIPVVAGLAGMVVAWDFVASTYEHRHFTPPERLLTQARILWFYVGLLAWPHIRHFALFHDQIALSTGLLEPWTTALAVAAWIALVAMVLLWGVRRRSPWAFGVAWFLVGHALESSVIGLELVFEHRNYVPAIGPILAAGYYFLRAGERLHLRSAFAATIAVIVVALLGFTTMARSSVWADRHTLFETSVRNHPDSSRSNGQYAVLLMAEVGDPAKIFHHYQRAAALNPREVLALVEMSKMLQGYILRERSREGAHGPPDRAAGPAPDPFTAELRADLAHLEALDAGIAAEIAQRLDGGPVETSTIMGLVSLRSCIQNELPPCVELTGRAIDWFEQVARSARVRENDRAIAMVQVAKLYAIVGRVDDAVATVERAIAANPDDLHVRFELAMLHVERGDATAVRVVIDDIEAITRYTGARADDLAALRGRLDALERGAGAPGS